MKYLIMVSHGQFAEGLKDALSMLAGQREDVLALGLQNGKSADEFAEEFSNIINPICQDDEIILLHNSHTPYEYKSLSKDKILSDDNLVMSRLLRKILL